MIRPFLALGEITSVFKDAAIMQWMLEATTLGPNLPTLLATITTIKLLGDISTQNLHVAFGATNISGKNYL